jgi:hypothetical protein
VTTFVQPSSDGYFSTKLTQITPILYVLPRLLYALCAYLDPVVAVVIMW